MTTVKTSTMGLYRYLPELDVHCVDCAGRVNLATGLARLKVLESELASRPPKSARRKLLLDFRETIWENEDAHRELSLITRRDFGLHAGNETVRVAILNRRAAGAISDNEHWFLDEAAALVWLEAE
jgi:hypothetical protein